jgi:hypothetical protein
MQTTYSMDILPETHPVFKPEMIPMDFSAFNNFNIARHSYWEKTPEEIQTFLATGQFPERAQNTQQNVNNVAPAANTYAAPQTNPVPQTTPTPAQNPSVATNTFGINTNTQAAQNVTTGNPTPTRNFNGFSF